MQEKESFIAKKAFEISYALLRIGEGAKVKGGNFGFYLEEQAYKILLYGTSGEYEKAEGALRVSERFLHLGADTGHVASASAEVVVQEIRQLGSAIAEYRDSAMLKTSEISEVFSKNPKSRKENASALEKKEETEGIEPFSGVFELSGMPISGDSANIAESEENSANVAESNVIYGSQTRQSMILDFVRQGESCRFKDIQEFFPSISPRTLRYDLEKLTERGLIEKVGVSGPRTYYQARAAF